MLLDSSQTCTRTETWIWGSGYCDPKSNFYSVVEVMGRLQPLPWPLRGLLAQGPPVGSSQSPEAQVTPS